MKTIKKVATPVKTLSYQLEVKVNDIEFKTKAKDIETALTKFVESPVFPLGSKTTAIIKYSKGKNTAIRVLRPQVARRVLRGIALKPSYLAVLAAQLEDSLK